MSWREAGELISVSALVSCTWRRLGREGGRDRERQDHEKYLLLLSYIHCSRDNLNEKIWDVRREGGKSWRDAGGERVGDKKGGT